MDLKTYQECEKRHVMNELKPLSIAIVGRRNSGKSSITNLLTGQNTAIVSHIAGTTTDPVRKRVEIYGLGAVTFIDTAGIDDIGEIGKKRADKSFEQLKQVDYALLVISENYFDENELNIIEQFTCWDVPYLIVHNKSDIIRLNTDTKLRIRNKCSAEIVEISTIRPDDREILINKIITLIKADQTTEENFFSGLVSSNDIVLLITPIDRQAPKGRLILPQNQSIRYLLDMHCITIVIQQTEIQRILSLHIKPALVVCDSSVFSQVTELLPEEIPLTSFSILFAYHKGDFNNYVKGTPKISELSDGDNLLILESCTHQTSCEDIGRVKLPRMIEKFTGKKLKFTIISGVSELPDDITQFSLAIQCGGCMVSKKQLTNRMRFLVENRIPISNYGMAIAYMNGIFEKSIAPFQKIKEKLT